MKGLDSAFIKKKKKNVHLVEQSGYSLLNERVRLREQLAGRLSKKKYHR